MSFEEEFTNESAFISGEVILGTFGKMLEYYPMVLGSALRELSVMSGKSVLELLKRFEEENDLVGVLEDSQNQLTAGREVLGSVLGKVSEK